MASRKRTPDQTPSQPPAPPVLKIPRDEARQRILAQIDIGNALLNGSWHSEGGSNNPSQWRDYNYEMLRRMFTTEEYAKRFSGAGISLVLFAGDYRDPNEDISPKVNELKSLLARLDIIDEDVSVNTRIEAQQGEGATDYTKKGVEKSPSRVFLVHGRDEEAKAIAARYLQNLDMEPIILSEQASEGLSIIEKIERYSDVDFAIVLLTPDDVGRLSSAETSEDKPRCRQNVIMELGYFIAKLGRKKVCALKKGEIDMPTDFIGPVWTPMDAGGAWKLTLAKEMKAAGLKIDSDKLLDA